ncbi:hypothetical protein V1477_018137 [Vespula maculifrons]|uniref:Uncharacterized protein n=1 Tax=Vespula maculifrons TaxID=7453 RepID=A0ABD2AYK7_VESMC
MFHANRSCFDVPIQRMREKLYTPDTTGPRVSADKVLRVELCEGRPLKYGVRGTGLDTSERVNSSPSVILNIDFYR